MYIKAMAKKTNPSLIKLPKIFLSIKWIEGSKKRRFIKKWIEKLKNVITQVGLKENNADKLRLFVNIANSTLGLKLKSEMAVELAELVFFKVIIEK